MTNTSPDPTGKVRIDTLRRDVRPRWAKLTPNQVAAIRADPEDGQRIANKYGVHKSVVSKIRNNKIHVDPNRPVLSGFGALRSAWSAAGATAREEFLRWLWSEHPEIIGAVMAEPRMIERPSAA